MSDVLEYIGDYLTVTNLTVGAVAVVLCCGTGLVCLRMMANNAAVDAFRRIAPADPDGGGIGACAAPLVGLLLAILGVCAFRTYLVVLLAEPKEEEPPRR
jgi:hypothetical protein